MNVVLTICSANYLAHAKTLGDSVLDHNPEVHFVIGLVDVLSAKIDLNGFERFELIEVSSVLPEMIFQDFVGKYSVVEVNTAVKPFLMAYLYERDDSVRTVSYFDPDIKVYCSLSSLFLRVDKKGIIVTPHSCTYDNSADNIRGEKSMLAVGIYNLGFIATSRSTETLEFLRWWMLRLKDHCSYRPEVPGTFFDQNWVMLAGLYFEHFFIEKNLGYNLAWWNLFERRVSLHNNAYFINKEYPLLFAHFSGYKPEYPDNILSRSKYTIDFTNCAEVKPLFEDYRSDLIKNKYDLFSSLKWAYAREEVKTGRGRLILAGLKQLVLHLLGKIPARIRKRIIGLFQQSLNNTILNDA